MIINNEYLSTQAWHDNLTEPTLGISQSPNAESLDLTRSSNLCESETIMRKNNIPNIVVHIENNASKKALDERVSQFYVDVIERRLANSNLTTIEKIAVIDKIIENLKLKEVNDIIK